MFIQDTYEFAKGDENLIKALHMEESETDEIQVEVHYEAESFEDTFVPYGDTFIKMCPAGIEVDITAVIAKLNNQEKDIKNLLSPKTIEFYENKILEGLEQ